MLKKLLMLYFPLLLMIPVSTLANESSEIENMPKGEEIFFSEFNIVNTKEEVVNVEGELKEFVVQEFEELIPVHNTSRLSDDEESFILKKGLEIMDKDDFEDRKLSQRQRVNISDRYADGRGTYLYAEIHYTTRTVLDTNWTLYNMNYLYCNSSGSTLSAYSVTYGQSGWNDKLQVVTQNKTVNIDTTVKTFSTNLNWTPILDGEGVLAGFAGMTQEYTTRGWTNSWTFNIL